MANVNAGYAHSSSLIFHLTTSRYRSLSTTPDPSLDKERSPLYPHHPLTLARSLIATANAIVNPRGKGIYATDETPDVIEARLCAAEGKNGDGKERSEDEKRERRWKWRADLYESLPVGTFFIHPPSSIDH